MGWKEEYRSKLMSISEALSLIRSDDVILTQNGVAMPCALIEGLYDLRGHVENIELNLGVTKRDFRVFGKESNGSINIRTNFLYPGERNAILQGSRMGVLLIDLHDTFADKRDHMCPNVALAGVVGPDENGYFSMGLHGGDIPALKDRFDRIIVQVNNNSPYVYGEGNLLHVDDVDAIVEYDEPLQELPVKTANELDEKIASFIIDRIPDGATIQFGVGGPGMVVGKNLTHPTTMTISNTVFRFPASTDGQLRLGCSQNGMNILEIQGGSVQPMISSTIIKILNVVPFPGSTIPISSGRTTMWSRSTLRSPWI